MGRVRYSLAEAHAEAIRRAEVFVAARPDREEWRLLGAFPNGLAPPSQASKHPLAWVVGFVWMPLDGVGYDGCELFVAVDLEADTVGLGPW